MKIMFDTNVLISMILFHSKDFRKLLIDVTEKNNLILSSFVINELSTVANRKFPEKLIHIDDFLSELSYELIETPKDIDYSLFDIRDKKDYPVLYSAIISNVDIFITGDTDFLDVKVQHIEIMTPRDYINKYC